MGLYVSFTPGDLGYQLSLTQSVLGETFTVDVDYGPACQAFVDTFLASATGACPVDTGYLRSTISASTDGQTCTAEATAEYAQYVEYGTWKQRAQPYFTPAVEAGIEAFRALAGQALSEAQQMLHDLCQSVIDAAKEVLSDGSFLGDMGATLAGAAMLMLAFPILLTLYGIMDTIFGAGDDSSFAEGVSGTNVQVIIT